MTTPAQIRIPHCICGNHLTNPRRLCTEKRALRRLRACPRDRQSQEILAPSIPQSLFFPSLQLLYTHLNFVRKPPYHGGRVRESLWRRLWRNATTLTEKLRSAGPTRGDKTIAHRWLFTRTLISLTRRFIFSLWIWFRGRGLLVSFRVFGCIAFRPHAKFIYLFSFILFGSDRTRHFLLKKSKYCCVLGAASAPE